MWFVKYGNEYLHDPRTGLILSASKPTVELNTSTTFEFQITYDHPLYNKIRERDLDNSVVVYQDDDIIYKGEIVEIEKDFQLTKTVTCKSDLGFFNGAVVRPYSTYQGESSRRAPATVDGYFDFLIDEYNGQASEVRKFKKGINEGGYLEWSNYIYRSDTSYPTVGSVIKEKIIDSLGGYIRTRYEDDGTYIDLLRDMPNVNAQIIDFGVNLLDFVDEETSDDIVSFVVPVGKEIENVEENSEKLSVKLTISSDSIPYLQKVVDKRQAELNEATSSEDPDEERIQNAQLAYNTANEALENCKSASVNRELEEGYHKCGDMIYSMKAVTKYGWIGSVVEYNDVTLASNLVTRGLLSLKANESPIKTLTLTAVDLSMINPDLKPIKLGDYVRVRSKPHDVDSYFLCTKIEYDLSNPGNNTFTLGTTFDTLTGQQNRRINALNATIRDVYEAAEKISAEAKAASITANEAKNTAANISGKFIHIMYSANADGSGMTDTPNVTTTYIGIYSGDSETAPTDNALYTWSLIKGDDGVGVKGDDGSPAYLHIKYSDDGVTFTDDNGETPGDWIGTYSDNIEQDSTVFSQYTWKKIKGETGETGNGIKSTTVTYQASSSGTVIPTGEWSTSIPSVSAGQYLWTKTVITYTDDTETTSYTVGMMGATGSDGKGIESTAVTYKIGTSGTEIPTGEWTTDVPATTAEAPYLWSRTITTYTDGTTSTMYSVGATPEGVTELLNQTQDSLSSSLSTLSDKVDSLDESLSENTDEINNVKILVDSNKTAIATLEQQSDKIEMDFQTIEESVYDLNKQLTTEVNVRLSYIRFEDGNIILGRVVEPGENDFQVVISNEKMSFLQNGTEIAYLSNNKLYITDAQVTSSHRIGNYLLSQRSNGNFGIRWIDN